MKLTKEDIEKFGTTEEKKQLKEISGGMLYLVCKHNPNAFAQEDTLDDIYGATTSLRQATQWQKELEEKMKVGHRGGTSFIYKIPLGQLAGRGTKSRIYDDGERKTWGV